MLLQLPIFCGSSYIPILPCGSYPWPVQSVDPCLCACLSGRAAIIWMRLSAEVACIRQLERRSKWKTIAMASLQNHALIFSMQHQLRDVTSPLRMSKQKD